MSLIRLDDDGLQRLVHLRNRNAALIRTVAEMHLARAEAAAGYRATIKELQAQIAALQQPFKDAAGVTWITPSAEAHARVSKRALEAEGALRRISRVADGGGAIIGERLDVILGIAAGVLAEGVK